MSNASTGAGAIARFDVGGAFIDPLASGSELRGPPGVLLSPEGGGEG